MQNKGRVVTSQPHDLCSKKNKYLRLLSVWTLLALKAHLQFSREWSLSYVSGSKMTYDLRLLRCSRCRCCLSTVLVKARTQFEVFSLIWIKRRFGWRSCCGETLSYGHRVKMVKMHRFIFRMVKWCLSFFWWFYLRATRDDEEKKRPVTNDCYEGG